MDSSTVQIAPTATEAEPEAAQSDKRQLWIDLMAQVRNATTTQDRNNAARQLVAVETELEAASKTGERLEDLAEAAKAAQDCDDAPHDHKMNAHEAEIDRILAENEWLLDLMKVEEARTAYDLKSAVHQPGAESQPPCP